MNDLRQLREIEKLVEDSVFHPAPCHQLRERVLQNAAEAKVRQKLWQRFVVATSIVTGALVVTLIVLRPGTGSRVAVEPGPLRVQIQSPGHAPVLPNAPSAPTAPNSSLGESLYFHPNALSGGGSPQAGAAAGSEQSKTPIGTDLATRRE